MRHFATELGASGWVQDHAQGPVMVLVQTPRRVKRRLQLVMVRVAFHQLDGSDWTVCYREWVAK